MIKIEQAVWVLAEPVAQSLSLEILEIRIVKLHKRVDLRIVLTRSTIRYLFQIALSSVGSCPDCSMSKIRLPDLIHLKYRHPALNA